MFVTAEKVTKQTSPLSPGHRKYPEPQVENIYRSAIV